MRGLSDAGFLLMAEMLANNAIDLDAILVHVYGPQQLNLFAREEAAQAAASGKETP